MTPKEKAKEMFNKYYQTIDIYNFENVKQCALIAADEMISVLADLNGIYNITPALTYWQEVKQEIEKI